MPLSTLSHIYKKRTYAYDVSIRRRNSSRKAAHRAILFLHSKR